MTLSATCVQAMTAHETGHVFVVLVEIDHATLSEPIRFCPIDVQVDTVGTEVGLVSNGDFYLAYPFQIDFPGQDPDAPPSAKLRIDNVNRSIIAAVRGLTSPPTVSISIVLADSPDTVEVGPLDMSLTSIEYNAFVIEGTLGPEDFLNEPWPRQKFTPQTVPGLF